MPGKKGSSAAVDCLRDSRSWHAGLDPKCGRAPVVVVAYHLELGGREGCYNVTAVPTVMNSLSMFYKANCDPTMSQCCCKSSYACCLYSKVIMMCIHRPRHTFEKPLTQHSMTLVHIWVSFKIAGTLIILKSAHQ